LAKCSFRSDSIVLSFMSNYFNLLSMHACQTQLIIKWMGGRACNFFGETSRILNVP